MEYLEWNDSIARHFFNEEHAGKEILLYVNDEILAEIGKANGCGVDDFVESVKNGPPWVTRSGFCQKALGAFERWREKGREYPPYISYLACFVLAAGIHGDFDPRAYYPRLRKLLGEADGISGLPSFDKMIDLWDDLEKWTVEDKHEELGRFVARIRGGWWKVGLPLAQTIISKDEQRRLPVLFEAADLDPLAPPSERVMLKLMRYYGDRVFEKRTLRVLNIEKGEDIILKNSLVEMVLGELEEWDGTVQLDETREGCEEGGLQAINSRLRICIQYDPVSQQVKCRLRLKTNRDYPDDGLTFQCEQFPGIPFYCEEAYQGWSKSFKNQESEVLDAAAIDWTRGIRFEDHENSWRASLKGDSARLFTSGKADGLPGWVETNRLERGVPFFVSTFGIATSKVRSWGESSCDSFNEFNVHGLPPGWSLFKGLNASVSCEGIDVLTVSSSVRLLLRGGVRLRKGNTYLYTAPPLIVLENAAEEASVTVNGKVLRNEGNGLHSWKLPSDIPPNEIIRIEAKTRDDELKKILRLEEPRLSGSFDQTPWRSAEGIILSEGSNCTRIRGAVVEQTGNGFPSFDLMPVHSKPRILLGNIPGQVAQWPEVPLPSGWEPVWSIERTGRKKWKVSCCRRSISSVPLPHMTASPGKGKDVKKWKKYIWINRKKMTEPQIPVIRQKWVKFKEAARNV